MCNTCTDDRAKASSLEVDGAFRPENVLLDISLCVVIENRNRNVVSCGAALSCGTCVIVVVLVVVAHARQTEGGRGWVRICLGKSEGDGDCGCKAQSMRRAGINVESNPKADLNCWPLPRPPLFQAAAVGSRSAKAETAIQCCLQHLCQRCALATRCAACDRNCHRR